MIKLISRIRLTSGADLIGANLEDLILNLGTIYEEDIFILYNKFSEKKGDPLFNLYLKISERHCGW